MATHQKGNRGIEENTMAILDASGFSKNSEHANDDSIAFLEAVRSASLVPENGIPPTKKMFDAVFKILKNENSLDVIIASFLLLNELDKYFPRVYVSRKDKTKTPTLSTAVHELVVDKEIWSPFIYGLDSASGEEEADKNSSVSLDSSAFHLLIQDLSKVADEKNSKALEVKSLRNMLLLQYLVNVLEGDFLPRNCAYKETLNWTHLRESFLSMLLGSRRISYKALVKDCLSIIYELCHVSTEFSSDIRDPEHSSAELLNNCDATLAIALPEAEKCTCIAMEKLMLMIIELDLSKKTADMQGLTTRADSVRTPLVEIILDELTYNRDILSPFFQVFNEPKWKLEIIVQYFSKFIAKPSVRTRRSSDSTSDATLDGVLKYLSNGNSTKSILKKISSEVAQLLLAHAFQAYLSLPPEKSVADISDVKEGVQDSSLAEVCKRIISAFTSLRKTEEHMEILPFGKEALFTAATILSATL